MYDKIKTYTEFVESVKKAGFMPFGKTPSGYVSLEDVTYPGSWHTGMDTDPWLWKDRIAFEGSAAYSKVIGKKPTFISMEWYPYFLAIYRPSLSVEERYESGAMGVMAVRIYECLKDNRPFNTHELKVQLGIGKDNGGKFESALVELQASMDITVFGASRRRNKQGESYGWLVSEYTTVEQWADPELLEKASGISRETALNKVSGRIKETVPGISDRDICRFLGIK